MKISEINVAMRLTSFFEMFHPNKDLRIFSTLQTDTSKKKKKKQIDRIDPEHIILKSANPDTFHEQPSFTATTTTLSFFTLPD